MTDLISRVDWSVFANIAGVLGLVISLVTATAVAVANRKDVRIEINDTITHDGVTFLNVLLINRSRLDIVITKILVKQKSKFVIDQRSQIRHDIFVHSAKRQLTIKAESALLLPIHLGSYGAVSGVLAAKVPNNVCTLGGNQTARVKLYTSRGVIRRLVRVNTDFSLND